MKGFSKYIQSIAKQLSKIQTIESLLKKNNVWQHIKSKFNINTYLLFELTTHVECKLVIYLSHHSRTITTSTNVYAVILHYRYTP